MVEVTQATAIDGYTITLGHEGMHWVIEVWPADDEPWMITMPLDIEPEIVVECILAELR